VEEFIDALGLAAQIKSRSISPLEALEACLEAIDRLNPALNAVIWRDDSAARAEAVAIGERLANGEDVGAFAGVPFVVKDLTKAKGQPVTYGSGAVPETPATEDELVIAALRRAGFVACGRTNTPEFGPLTASENSHYGITRNPWDTSRTSGGSSGGTAAAVASGMVPIGHGNDGGGSIRIPSSCCGLVGLKPSRWRVPSVSPGWFGVSVEGVLTRTVADTAAALDCISEPDLSTWEQAPQPRRPFSDEVGEDPGRLRIALLTTSALGVPVDDGPREACERTGRLLESLGHSVEVLEQDVLDLNAVEPFLSVVNTSYGAFDDVDWDRVEPHNRAGHDAGLRVDGLAVVRSLKALRELTRPVVKRWGSEFDVLVTPTMTIEPPPAGQLLAEAHGNPEMPPPTALAMVAFTVTFNLTGQPAISLPLGEGSSGIPIGVQLVGAPWGEAQLIQVASQLEEAAPWRDRHPQLLAPGS
jgi:amidase